MNDQSKTKEELILELRELRQKFDSLKKARGLADLINRDRELILKGKIVDNMSEGVFLIRTDDGVIVYANPSINRMFRAAPNELTGKRISSVNAPNSRSPEEVAGEIAHHLHTKGTWSGEIQNIRMDGTTFWSYSVVSTYNDPKFGKVWIAIHQDISELKIANKAFEKIELRFSTIFNDAPLGIALIDSVTGRIYEVNPMFAKIAGRTIEEMGRFDWISITHPDDIQEDLDKMALLVKGEINGFQMEKRYIRPDSSIVWINMTISRLIREEDMPLCHLCMIEDITERKQSEEKRFRSERDLKRTQQITNIGSFYIDLTTNHVTWTEELYKIYGFDPALPIPPLNESQKLFTPESWERLSASITKTAETGNPYEIELRTIRKDGSMGWIWARGEAEIKAAGKITGLLGAVQDITERKQIEEELRKAIEQTEKSEMYFRSVFEGSPNGLSITSFDGALKTNKAFSDLLGYTFDEFQTKTWMQITHPEDIPKSRIAINAILSGKQKSIQIDKRYLHKNGSIIYVYLKMTLQNSDQDKPLFIISSIVDVTRQKQAEIELKESEAKYRFIFDNAIEGMYRTTIDGKSLMANPALATMLGYNSTDEYLREMKDSARQVWHNAEQRAVYISLLEKNNIIQGYECQLKRKDGSPIWVSLNAKIVQDENGNKLYSEGFLEEITERKKAEIELIAAKEKAEESDRLKSAFLANMSHEIRTPMNGILGFAELLKDSKLSGEEKLDYISIIEKSGARMLNIINDIVDISKIESGHMKLSVGESNLNEQIEYLYTFFKPEIDQKGMKLLFKNSLLSKESIIQTDREKVFAILTNLIKNAIKYSKTGTIEFGYHVVTSLGATALLEFFVKDQGIGIPKDRQNAIFERFIQADVGDKRAYEGAGLGLAIAKSYVEMLGGKIWLESEPGIGSVFYFTLPYVTVMDEKVTSKDNIATGDTLNVNKKLKILIAEDDKDSGMLISIALKKISNEILKVKTGIEAVEACRNNPNIDLILMDIQMPLMDGYEATRQIRQFNKNIIIIAQTAYGLNGDREKAIDAGCNDYISKPINMGNLIRLVQSYFK